MSKQIGIKLIIDGQEEAESLTLVENAAALSIRPGDKLRSEDYTRTYEVLEKRYIITGGVFSLEGVVTKQIYP